MITLAASESAYLVSVFKPLVFFAVLVGWAWVAAFLNKDAGYYFLKQNLWGLAHIGAAAVGLGLMLLIPIFWLGLPIAVLIVLGEFMAYAYFRNQEVPASAKWSFNLDSFKQKIEAHQAESAIARAAIKLKGPKGQAIQPPAPTDAEAIASFNLLETLANFAIPRGAQQLDLRIEPKSASITIRIDGVPYPQEAPEAAEALKLADYIKDIAGLDVDDRRKKQVGKLGLELDEYGLHDCVVTTSGSTRGLHLRLEIDPDKEFTMNLDRLGLLEAQRAEVDKLIEEPGGVVLVTGPGESGVSTFCLAMLDKHDAYTSSIMTFEQKVGLQLEGVSHNAFPAGASKDQLLENFGAMLRSDPNAVYVSHIVDRRMAELIAETAKEVRFYIPLPAKDTQEGLKLWMKLVGDRKIAAKSIRAVVATRLVRRLCTTCRAPYTPEPSALKKLGLSPEKVDQFYRASGQVMVKDKERTCPACHGMGYRGRTGVHEVMSVDDDARRYLIQGESDHFRGHLRKRGFTFLQEAALAKVANGTTDIKEVTRVMSGKDDQPRDSETKTDRQAAGA